MLSFYGHRYMLLLRTLGKIVERNNNGILQPSIKIDTNMQRPKNTHVTTKNTRIQTSPFVSPHGKCTRKAKQGVHTKQGVHIKHEYLHIFYV